MQHSNCISPKKHFQSTPSKHAMSNFTTSPCPLRTSQNHPEYIKPPKLAQENLIFTKNNRSMVTMLSKLNFSIPNKFRDNRLPSTQAVQPTIITSKIKSDSKAISDMKKSQSDRNIDFIHQKINSLQSQIYDKNILQNNSSNFFVNIRYKKYRFKHKYKLLIFDQLFKC